MVWPPADRPLSTVVVDQVLDVSGADFLYITPSILEDLANSPESLRKLERLAVIGYGGGEFVYSRTLSQLTTS
jgi:hypothetical protein